MLNFTIEQLDSFHLAMQVRSIDKNDKDGIRRLQSDYMRNGYQEFAFGQFAYRSPVLEDGTFRYGLGNVCWLNFYGTYKVYFGGTSEEELPNGFTSILIPAMVWAKIEVVGPAATAIPEMYDRIDKELPEYLERIDLFTLEEYMYGVNDSEKKDSRAYIWVPVRVKDRSKIWDVPMYRFATIGDIDTILDFIKELAAYEESSGSFVATQKLLKEWMFDRKIAESQLVYMNGDPVGFALYFYNFSTWLGRGGIYIEDVYIQREFRNHGIGRELFHRIAQKAVREGCGRMEWCCLEWNTPSLEFYKKLGAIRMDGWKTLRLTGDALKELGKQDSGQ